MNSDVQDASNIRAVVAQALIHNSDRGKACDAIAAVLGESREKAKELVFAYYYDAGNSHLLKLLTRNAATRGAGKYKPWHVSWHSNVLDMRIGVRFATLREGEAYANDLAQRENSVTLDRVV